MRLEFCIFAQFITSVLASVITQYDYIQQDGEFTERDMFRCQLRANGNVSCAIRLNTTTSNELVPQTDPCEQLSVDWCYSPVLEPGYTYMGKSTVVWLEPETYISLVSFRYIIDELPMSVTPGAKLKISFTHTLGVMAPQVDVRFKSDGGLDIYTKIFFWHHPINPGETSTFTATFGTTYIYMTLNNQEFQSIYLFNVADIRILRFDVKDKRSAIHRVTYKAAPYGN